MTSRVGIMLALLALPAAAVAQSPADSTRGGDTLVSGASFRGATLRRLPIDDPRQAFALVPGVVLRSGEIGTGTAPDLSIRGGRPGQASVYVDGAPVRFQTFGTQGIGLAPNAIAEAQVTTGVAPVFIADAGSGLITYVTPAGGERLAGQVRWDSDEPFGNAISVGYNRIEGSVGGPLPVARNLTFYLSTTLQGQRSGYRGMGAADVLLYVPNGVDTVVEVTSGTGTTFVAVPAFAQWTGSCDAGANGGVECQGIRRPMDWSSARRAQGKVEYVYGASRLSVTGLASDLQQRFFPGTAIMDAALYQGRRAASAVAIVNWRHQLGGTEGPLALNVNLSAGRDRDVAGLLTPESEVATRDPYLGIEFETLRFTGTDVFPFPVTEAIVRNVRTNSGLRTPYLNRLDLVNSQPYRLNPYGLLASGWPTQGMDGPISFVDEHRVNGRGAVEWRRGERHQITVGVDAERTSLSLYQSSLLRQAFMDVTVARPTRRGVFAGDRIDLGNVVVDLGMRFDAYNSDALFPKTPGRIYSHPRYQTQYLNASTDPAVYAAFLADTAIWTPAEGHHAISPRARIAAAVSPRTSIRFGYGRQVEAPAYQLFFQHANSDLDFTNTNDLFGRDVGFATATLLELGIRSAVTSSAGLDAAVYRQSRPEYLGRIKPFADPLNVGDTVTLFVVSLEEVPAVTGLDVGLQWHQGAWLAASAAYTFQRAHRGPGGTTHAAAAAVALRVPTDWNEGSFVGMLARDLSVDLTVRATSGLPYTRLFNSGSGALAPGGGFSSFAAEPLNASRLPWTKRLDLRLTRAVRAGGRDWTVYADLRNVLNFRNTVALFAETGGVVNAAHRTRTLANEYSLLASEASSNSALEVDGTTINLSACDTWQNPVNCVALTRVERRYGDGDGLYTLTEQTRALNAFYDAFFGPSRFYGSGRTLRLGVELAL